MTARRGDALHGIRPAAGRTLKVGQTILVHGVILLVALVVAGCGDGGQNVETADGEQPTSDQVTEDVRPVPIDLVALIGSSWTLRFGAGPEGEVSVIEGWPITLTFDEENLGGTAACNDYGGSYTIEGTQLRLADLGQNSAGCLPEVQESERVYMAALVDVDGINLVGDELALSGPSTELIFGRNEPVPLDDLVGKHWLLEATIQDGDATAVQGEPATLFLGGDGTLTGGTGCRSLAGNYIVAGNEVALTDFSAEGDCPTTLFDQDGKVIGVLEGGFVAEVDGETLLVTSAGNQGLRYRAVGEDELAGLSGTPVASDAELLDGVEWIFTGGDSPDGPIADPRTVDPDQTITLTMSGDTYEGTANCNSYGGRAEIGNGRLALGVPEAEEEGCGDALDAIAAAYYDALALMTEFGVEADRTQLVANGSETELWFELAG